MKDDSHPNWKKVNAALRETGLASRPADEDLSAPHGFATRVVSRHTADLRADASGLSQWRRWSLAGAACAALLFGGSFLVKPAREQPAQFIPVPELEQLVPNSPNR